MFLRNTPARRKILAVFEKAGKPVCAADILKKVCVNKTTVYREIETLLHEDAICRIDFGDGIGRYELRSLPHHHHLICKKCGKVDIILFNENIFAKIAKDNFKIESHKLEFFGKCAKCQL